MQGNLGNANSQADHLRDHLKKFEAQRPDLNEGVTRAYKIVETHGEDLRKLQAELAQAQKTADDLERQAREAR